MIGFTAVALLGRPGEFIRPFLIGRKEGLGMSSQLAVWVVERLFDIGAFALIMAVNVIAFANQLKELDGFQQHPSAFNIFKMSAFGLLVPVVVAPPLPFLIPPTPHVPPR